MMFSNCRRLVLLLGCALSSACSSGAEHPLPGGDESKMPVVEDRGAAGSHVWFESSVRLKLRNEWRFNAWGGAMGASGGSCVSLTHDELSDEQRTALEGLLL